MTESLQVEFSAPICFQNSENFRVTQEQSHIFAMSQVHGNSLLSITQCQAITDVITTLLRTWDAARNSKNLSDLDATSSAFSSQNKYQNEAASFTEWNIT